MLVFGRQILGLLLVFCALAVSAAPNDPYESLNRKVMGFNDVADRWVLAPVARVYHLLPLPIESRLHNAFVNLDGPVVIINQLLQGKPALALRDTGRFVLNTTVGLVGVFDVAQTVGLPRHDEDFGQTFEVWGIPAGPYIVLPLLGPSTPLYAVGDALETFAKPLSYLDEPLLRYGLRALGVVDKRAQLLEAEGLVSGDRYVFVRDAYLQRREFLVHDGNVPDAFLDGDD